MLVGVLALVGTPPFNIFLSKFFIITAGLGAGRTWLMIVCLLLLMVVFAAFIRVIASAVFGEKPDGMLRGESNWLTLAPGAILVALILALGLYLPPQLIGLLNAASSLVWTGDPNQQVALASIKDILMPLAQLMP
jgi:hydrogenase-4 component F